MQTNTSAGPVIFGEVLFDRFPDGSSVLGGAPFNVAWHLQGFGVRPLFISRIGDDALGVKIKQAMAQWGMDLSGLQIDSERSTGVVEVEFKEGEPYFSILPNRAYDFIEADQALAVLRQQTILYHGTLALRHSVSREALRALRQRQNFSIFLDINLRAPWWRANEMPALLEGGRWIKLNDKELAQLANLFSLPGKTPIEQAGQLQDAVEGDLLIVTRGAAGAFCRHKDGRLEAMRPSALVKVIDTVGAGDAFSAVMLLGLLRDWRLSVTLRRALDFAGAICGVRGAVVADERFYAKYLKKWSEL